MRRPITNQDGISLLEVVVAVALMGFFAVKIGSVFHTLWTGQSLVTNGSTLRSDVSNFGIQLLAIGRNASSCQKTGGMLVCQVDLEAPPVGNLTTVRFRLRSGQLVEEQSPPAGGGWNTVLALGNITDFIVCDPGDMTGSPVACPIQPVALSNAYNTLFAPSGSSRPFFRFFIRGVLPTSNTNSLPARAEFQSAFFSRNLSPFSYVVYQWGQQY